MEKLLDHLPKYNKMFVNEIKRLVIEGNQKSKEDQENLAYTILENFYRIPGLPFGYYLASDGICIFAPMVRGGQVKIVYNQQTTWSFIEKIFPSFKKYIQEKDIDYSKLTYRDKDQDCEWMQNEFAIAPALKQVCINVGLTMYYQSQQVLDYKLSDQACNQAIADDIQTINSKDFYHENEE